MTVSLPPLLKACKAFLESNTCDCPEKERLRVAVVLEEARMQFDAEMWESKYKNLKAQIDEVERAFLRAKAGAL